MIKDKPFFFNEEYISVYAQKAFHKIKTRIVEDSKKYRSKFAPFIKDYKFDDKAYLNEFISNDKNVIRYAELKMIKKDSDEYNKINEVITEVNNKTSVLSYKFILGADLETSDNLETKDCSNILKLIIDKSSFEKDKK